MPQLRDIGVYGKVSTLEHNKRLYCQTGRTAAGRLCSMDILADLGSFKRTSDAAADHRTGSEKHRLLLRTQTLHPDALTTSPVCISSPS